VDHGPCLTGSVLRASQPAGSASATASAAAAAAHAASVALAPHPPVSASTEPVTTLPPKPAAARVINAAKDVRLPGWPGLNVTWVDTRPLRIVVVANGKVNDFYFRVSCSLLVRCISSPSVVHSCLSQQILSPAHTFSVFATEVYCSTAKLSSMFVLKRGAGCTHTQSLRAGR
jgi:hypothetical protein